MTNKTIKPKPLERVEPAQTFNLNLTGKVVTAPRSVPKAYFRSEAIRWDDTISMNATTWIPKANPTKGKPRVCLTFKLGENTLRLYGSDADELEGILKQIYFGFIKYKPELSRIHRDEVEQWYKLKKAFENAMLNG